jgi:glycosyltransferase involved in cell wall biosynthesis
MVSHSIVILTYNQRQTLNRLLMELAGQIKNPQTFEVVITDDGSADIRGRYNG